MLGGIGRNLGRAADVQRCHRLVSSGNTAVDSQFNVVGVASADVDDALILIGRCFSDVVRGCLGGVECTQVVAQSILFINAITIDISDVGDGVGHLAEGIAVTIVVGQKAQGHH